MLRPRAGCPPTTARAPAAALDVALVVDISGSMEPYATALLLGAQQFLAGAKGAGGGCTIHIAAYNHHFVSIAEGSPERAPSTEDLRRRLRPEGQTALHDAIVEMIRCQRARLGRSATRTEGGGVSWVRAAFGNQAPQQPDATQPPMAATLTVITDGQENASREGRKERVKELVLAHQSDGARCVFVSPEGGADGRALYGFESAERLELSDAGVQEAMRYRLDCGDGGGDLGAAEDEREWGACTARSSRALGSASRAGMLHAPR